MWRFPTRPRRPRNLFPIYSRARSRDCHHAPLLLPPLPPSFDLRLPPGSQSGASGEKHKHHYHDGPSPGVNLRGKRAPFLSSPRLINQRGHLKTQHTATWETEALHLQDLLPLHRASARSIQLRRNLLGQQCCVYSKVDAALDFSSGHTEPAFREREYSNF